VICTFKGLECHFDTSILGVVTKLERPLVGEALIVSAVEK
jgi:hypothetical protein